MVVVLEETGAQASSPAAPVSSSTPDAGSPGVLDLAFVCSNCCREWAEPFCGTCGSTHLRLVAA